MNDGSCLCGTLQYRLDGPVHDLIHCHCSMCRKHHGSGFASWVIAPLEAFRWVDGVTRLRRFRSSEHGVRCSCEVCGAPAPMLMETLGLAVLPAGALQGSLPIKPSAHWFVAYRAPWDEIADALACHAAFPPEVGGTGVERPAPPASPPGTTAGSCLCGEVGFSFDGAPRRMLHCHCSRCQRGRAAAHATNALVPIDAFRWTRGEQAMRRYKLPDAKFFAVGFCERCGGSLPVVSVERGVVIVPAGTLDDDPGLRPQGHIFIADKAPWFDIVDALPRFEGYPSA